MPRTKRPPQKKKKKSRRTVFYRKVNPRVKALGGDGSIPIPMYRLYSVIGKKGLDRKLVISQTTQVGSHDPNYTLLVLPEGRRVEKTYTPLMLAVLGYDVEGSMQFSKVHALTHPPVADEEVVEPVKKRRRTKTSKKRRRTK